MSGVGRRRGPLAVKPSSAALPKYRLRWTLRAVSDLEEIEGYIAADDPKAAARWVSKLMEHAKKAAWTPHAGRVVPELNRVEIRELLLRAYRIVYRIAGEEVHVLTIFEGHRLFPADVKVEPTSE